MGAQLVGQAFAFAARDSVSLKPNETLLLLWMAKTAMDSDSPPRYFGSREESAFALGRMVPEEPDSLDPNLDEKQKLRAAAFQAVKTATQGLVSVNAIERIRRGGRGTRSEFAITFGASTGRKSLPTKVGNSYPESRKFLPNEYGIPTPQEQQEQQEPTTGINPAPRAPHVLPVENSWHPSSSDPAREREAS